MASGTAVSAATEIRYARGCGVLDGDDADIAAAVEAARDADVAILVLGDRSGLTARCTSGETRDRLELGLPGRQAELFAAVAATGTPIVLVLISGRALAIPAEADIASAVLHAWVPGEAGPQAIAEVLFGDVSPGRQAARLRPAACRPGARALQPHADGRAFVLAPGVRRRIESAALAVRLRALLHALRALRAARRGRARRATDGAVAISVEIANIGERVGDEVVQLYVRDLAASVTRPTKELRGFVRVSLAPGERRTVTFTLHAEQLAFTGLDGRLVVEPGRHLVMVGTSSADLPLQGEFEVTGEPRHLAARSRFFTDVEVGPAG